MEFQRASQGKEILMPRTGGSTTRATRSSRVRGASTQRQTVGSAIRPTEDAAGQWRIIGEKSGSTVFFERRGMPSLVASSSSSTWYFWWEGYEQNNASIKGG